ncbi:MAG: molybdopterin cofactor-binding domain-containing protein [Betaproteobacteria bacterium]
MSKTDDKTASSGKPKSMTRRLLLISAAVVGGGLAVGAGYIQNKASRNKAFVLTPGKGEAAFGAWFTIDPNGIVTAMSPHQEMGQGIMSLVASLIAEELDASPAQMRVIQAPVNTAYSNATMLLDGLPFRPDDHGLLAEGARWTMRRILEAVGINATGGSSSTRNVIDAVQHAAAGARQLLLQAAAAKLAVPQGELSIDNGVIRHTSGKSVGFGDVATAAAGMPLNPGTPKPRSQYRLLGKTGMPRIDVPSKTDGSAQFGIDVRLPGQLYAAIRHSPVFGGTVKSVNFKDKSAAIKGTVTGKNFVAAIATSYFAAKQAVDAAQVVWDEGANANLNSADIFARYAKALDAGEGFVYEKRGDVSRPANGKTVKAEYRAPFLAHATMEPLNCTVLHTGSKCDIWCGNQAPLLIKWLAGKAAGLESEAIEVHTLMMGGGFGRKFEMDVINEAIEIARSMPNVPVQTIWSREEDMQHDFYRPAALGRFEATLDDKGMPQRWVTHIAGPSIMAQATARMAGMAGGGMPDKTNVEGATFLPYALPALEVRHSLVDAGVPVGFWRSVGHSFTAFFVESFIDECAAAAGQDPLTYRLALLAANADDPTAQRFAAVLQTAAKMAGWGAPVAPLAGHKVGRGIAVAESFHSIVAHVAEVAVDAKGAVKVTKVFSALDCGFALDPVNSRAQIRSGVHFGLTAALFGEIEIEKGRVKQSNFLDYQMLTLGSAPVVEVEIINSGAELGGLGEPGVPPIAPAVANAIAAATGNFLHKMPFNTAELLASGVA